MRNISMCMSNDDGIFNARSVMCFPRSLLYGSAPTAKLCLAFLVAALSECVSASELLPEAPMPFCAAVPFDIDVPIVPEPVAPYPAYSAAPDRITASSVLRRYASWSRLMRPMT